MTQVSVSTNKAFGRTAEQTRRLKRPETPKRIRVPCGCCGHPVVMLDDGPIHSSSDTSYSHVCWYGGVCQCGSPGNKRQPTWGGGKSAE